ncbi:MAG: hypothetical protein JW789_00350 [Candidatus Aenigmarchaeota archaeon]|nr:hypothetical protein [Candidatus Aenigmarchaeota archaeon]
MASLYRQLKEIYKDKRNFLKEYGGDCDSIACGNFMDVCATKESHVIADYSMKNSTFSRMLHEDGFAEKLLEDYGKIILWPNTMKRIKTSGDLRDILGIMPFRKKAASERMIFISSVMDRVYRTRYG